MKTYWPIALLAFFLVCCGSDNPASEEPVDGDPSSSGLEHKPGDSSSSGKGHSHHGSSSSVSPGVPDVVTDTLIHDSTVVTDVDHLPDCTSEKEGESFMVESEKKLYFCVSKEWVESELVREFFELSCRDGMLVLKNPGEVRPVAMYRRGAEISVARIIRQWTWIPNRAWLVLTLWVLRRRDPSVLVHR